MTNRYRTLLWFQLKAKTFIERRNCGLAGAVGGGLWHPPVTSQTRYGHQMPLPSRYHFGDDCGHAIRCSDDVDVDDVGNFSGIEVRPVTRGTHSGVRNQHVDRAEVRLQSFSGLPQGIGIAYVSGQYEGTAAAGFDVLRDFG